MDLGLVYAENGRAADVVAMHLDAMRHALRAGAWHDAFDIVMFSFRALVALRETEAAGMILGHLTNPHFSQPDIWAAYTRPPEFIAQLEAEADAEELGRALERGRRLAGRRLAAEVLPAFERHGAGTPSGPDGDREPGRQPARIGEDAGQVLATAARRDLPEDHGGG